jgi:glycosyltransferase involved in cell wall biosynthesis
MKVAIVNAVWDARARTPAEILDRFRTLTGWANAVRAAGAADVQVFQRFHHAAELDRQQVGYRFIFDGRRPQPSPWYDGAALCEAITAYAPDVVHINGLDQPRLTRRLRRRLPASAIVVQDHGGFDPLAISASRRAWMRHGLDAADALLVATPPQRDVFAASGVAPATLRVVDVMEASTSLRVQGERARRVGLAVLFVGRLNANKDPLTVLDGFALFLKQRPDATFAFVYDNDELEGAIRSRLATDQTLAANVSLVGAVRHEDLAAVYARADLFVLGSHREGSGYAALEALACGVIPLLTDIPSFRWITDDGRVGALWRLGDSGSLSDALVRVTSSALEPQRRAVRAHFERHFTWDAIGRRAMEVYREFSRT